MSSTGSDAAGSKLHGYLMRLRSRGASAGRVAPLIPAGRVPVERWIDRIRLVAGPAGPASQVHFRGEAGVGGGQKPTERSKRARSAPQPRTQITHAGTRLQPFRALDWADTIPTAEPGADRDQI